MSIAHHRQPPRTSPRAAEHGASLIIVLAIMVIGALTIAGLLTYTQTSLRNAQSYRARTERVQAASDAVDLALAEIRPDRTKGTAVTPTVPAVTPTVSATYGAATATCDAETDSGKPNLAGGYADRTVNCVGKVSGRPIIQTRVQMLDRNGDEPGAEIQVLGRSVAG